MKQEVCSACGNTGITIDNPLFCSKCGRYADGRNGTATNIDKIQLAKLFIPKEYENIEFKDSMIKQTRKHLLGDKTFDDYCKFLTLALDNAKKGRKPKSSFIIYAPQGYGKTIWAFNMLKAYLSNGITVVPYLDLDEVDLVCKGNVILDVSYTDLIMSEVAIFKVPVLDDSSRIYKQILNILDKRSRKGNITYFTTRYAMNVLMQHDVYNSLLRAVNLDENVSKNLRYIRYKSTKESWESNGK